MSTERNHENARRPITDPTIHERAARAETLSVVPAPWAKAINTSTHAITAHAPTIATGPRGVEMSRPGRPFERAPGTLDLDPTFDGGPLRGGADLETVILAPPMWARRSPDARTWHLRPNQRKSPPESSNPASHVQRPTRSE
jgi:hypothetical protein